MTERTDRGESYHQGPKTCGCICSEFVSCGDTLLFSDNETVNKGKKAWLEIVLHVAAL